MFTLIGDSEQGQARPEKLLKTHSIFQEKVSYDHHPQMLNVTFTAAVLLYQTSVTFLEGTAVDSVFQMQNLLHVMDNHIKSD